MNDDLMTKYSELLDENRKLHEEVRRLKARLGIVEPCVSLSLIQPTLDLQGLPAPKAAPVSDAVSEIRLIQVEPPPGEITCQIDSMADTARKVALFQSLFKGRDDVYAKRWQNLKGQSGYSPVCENQWQKRICQKPEIKCSACPHQAYMPLNGQVIEEHLRGNLVCGVYPMLPGDTCWFLAMDFDEADWMNDVTVVRDVCMEFAIPASVERSRSGNGAHIWFFFESPVAAGLARRLGSVLLTQAMSRRHDINFSSYDRLFPNQDTMPRGGMGNLIALPLQKAARDKMNSVFVDEQYEPYDDQWAYLSLIAKISESQLNSILKRLGNGPELGYLIKDEEESPKPWEPRIIQLQSHDFPPTLEIVKADMLYIRKSGISERGLNSIKRLAAFRNPDFYRTQAMRLPTYNKPRIISCSDETGDYICLPRGCNAELVELVRPLGIELKYIDKTNHGRSIDVEFKGVLRDEQPHALDQLLNAEHGVLSGTTAFGKTIVAIKLIAERKTNTLIIVDKVSLVAQWKERISEFLAVNEAAPVSAQRKSRGRRKQIEVIGQIGAGKDHLSGIIDIAVMQSLNHKGNIKQCVEDYGMVIVDECHHVSAFSFEQVLKRARARYVYGLTATPTRKDGHHPIIYMQCGPIRYRDDARRQAARRPFDHHIIPRFTSFRIPVDKANDDLSIQEIYGELAVSEIRNQQIIDDVCRSYRDGRNCLILTQRTAHVEFLTRKLREEIPNVIALQGGMGTRTNREIHEKILNTPADEQLVLVATGKYIGEGFDEPRLDTLFLAMPVSWKGTLQQYAGRLHRLYDSKKLVQIYDYIDINIKMLENMYNKRLTGYAGIGYKASGEQLAYSVPDIIYDQNTFLPVLTNDLLSAQREIAIVSPFMIPVRMKSILQHLRQLAANGIKVMVITRPVSDFKVKGQPRVQIMLDLLAAEGITVILRTGLHQKFAVIDQKMVWYGSINLLGYGNAEESIMRLENVNIACELMKSAERTDYGCN